VAERYQAVSAVLVRVFFLNLLVAVAKLVLGYLTGAVSIVSDGFHSLTDCFSNIGALVGVRVARKPPDHDHPYGHRKYETIAAAAIAGFLMLVMIGIVEAAWSRVNSRAGLTVSPFALAVMLSTIAVNLVVTWYERRAGMRLESEVLLADALHTQSDVWTSVTVVIALAGAALGYPILDPIAALIVVVFIGHASWEIFRSTSEVLSDHIVIPKDEVCAVVMSVPNVMGCHAIRPRGSRDFVFLDLHIWMASETRLDAAHAISHIVKDRLMTEFPQIGDAVIHLEPPPRDDDPRNLRALGSRL
jgi:cation diffusion facilitator family transporter